jgi:arylsulfatase A-like enzyme
LALYHREGLVARPLAFKASAAALAACCLLALTVLLALAGNAYSAGNLTVPGVPNILFIITDDQELDGTMALMPKTAKWFKDGDPSAGIVGGTEFTQANVTTPLCCPSRSSIFTGRYAHNHGVRRNQDAGNLDQNTTLQYYLTQAGYRTGIFGKFLNQWDHTINPPNWTDWSIFSTQKYSGFEVNEQGTLKFNWKYQSNYITDQAEQFLQRANDDNDSRPWFMYVAATSPHGPYDPEPKYANDSVPALQADSAYFETDRKDKPYWVQSSLGDSNQVKSDWPDHLRMLKSADDLVDRVMTKLRSLNEDQDTLAFFISDNGFLWGEHGLNSKALPYLETLRVPMYLRWPGWAGHAGTRTDNRLVANIDMAPTALQAAGITPTTTMDGRSLLDTNSSRSRMYSEGWGRGPAPGAPACPGTVPTWSGLRTPTFHYIEYYETTPVSGQTCDGSDYTTNYNNVVDREYYDTTSDPQELTNLLGDDDAGNDPPTAELSAELAADRGCGGQSCSEAPSDPDTLITKKPESTSGSSTALFRVTSSEPNSTFECKLDDFLGSQPYVPCAFQTEWHQLANGTHKFEARSVGSGGARDSTPASYTWTVNTASPETEITNGPPSESTVRDATFEFSSNDSSAVFQCRFDSNLEADFQPCGMPKSYSNLADGSHKFEVRAIRSGSQIDPTPASRTWTIDATAPNTIITPDSKFSTHRSLATFTLSATASSSSSQVENPGRLECRLDTQAYAPCESVVTFTGLRPGGHSVRARAVDLFGNTDPTPAVFNWSTVPQAFRSATSTNWPEVTAGTEVRAIFPDTTGGFFIGGDFTEIGYPNGPRWQRTDLAHIKSDGTVDENWKPSTENGKVMSITGVGGLAYIGGTFTGIKGSNDAAFTPRNRLAAVSAGNGSLTSWNPNASNSVNGLMWGRKTASKGAAVTTLYAAGAFQQIGGATRRKVAEIKLSDGTVTAWNPDANSGATVNSLAVTDRYVYVGGAGMTQIGGKPRNNLAEIDRLTGQVTDWVPNPNGAVTSLVVNQKVSGLPTIYVGGSFTTIGQPTVNRGRAAEINIADNGSATAWDPSPSASPYSFQPFDCLTRCSTILGGSFATLKADSASPVTRSRLAEVDGNTGDAQSWKPNLDKAVYVMACGTPPSGSTCDSTNGTLALGGLFSTTGGIGGVPTTPRNLLAFYAGCPLTDPC